MVALVVENRRLLSLPLDPAHAGRDERDHLAIWLSVYADHASAQDAGGGGRYGSETLEGRERVRRFCRQGIQDDELSRRLADGATTDHGNVSLRSRDGEGAP